MPPHAQRPALVGGAAAPAVAAALLADPAIAIDDRGWKLTPLTARVLACFTAQVGVGSPAKALPLAGFT